MKSPQIEIMTFRYRFYARIQNGSGLASYDMSRETIQVGTCFFLDYLFSDVTEDTIYGNAISHEYIHHLLYKMFGQETCIRYDKVSSLGRDGQDVWAWR